MTALQSSNIRAYWHPDSVEQVRRAGEENGLEQAAAAAAQQLHKALGAALPDDAGAFITSVLLASTHMQDDVIKYLLSKGTNPNSVFKPDISGTTNYSVLHW